MHVWLSIQRYFCPINWNVSLNQQIKNQIWVQKQKTKEIKKKLYTPSLPGEIKPTKLFHSVTPFLQNKRTLNISVYNIDIKTVILTIKFWKSKKKLYPTKCILSFKYFFLIRYEKKNRRQNGSNSDTAVHVSIHECVCMQGAIH